MKAYSTRIGLLLKPIGTPDVVVICNNQRTEIILSQPTWINFDYMGVFGEGQLTVEHRNRQSFDGVTAVVVDSIKMNNIESPKIVLQGIYYPNDRESRRTNYIDWNGIWILNYTLPIYTWIHQVEGLGWIYD